MLESSQQQKYYFLSTSFYDFSQTKNKRIEVDCTCFVLVSSLINMAIGKTKNHFLIVVQLCWYLNCSESKPNHECKEMLDVVTFSIGCHKSRKNTKKPGKM